MLITNAIKSARNLATGRALASLHSYYDPRNPPSKFLRRSGPRIRIRCILSGFPRTGTHWIRNVLERSAGVLTGALGEASERPTTATPDVYLLKVHARNPMIARAKAIWLLPIHRFDGRYMYSYRDPRDAIISLFERYCFATGDESLTPEDFLARYDPVGQYRWEIRAWVLSRPKGVLPVRYEELRIAPEDGFRRIFAYLDISDSVAPIGVAEAVSQVERDGVDRPRRVAYGWKSAPARYAGLIGRVGDELRREIRALGYDVSC